MKIESSVSSGVVAPGALRPRIWWQSLYLRPLEHPVGPGEPDRTIASASFVANNADGGKEHKVTVALETILPSDDDAAQAAGALQPLQSYLARHPQTSEIVHLIVEDDDQPDHEGRQEIVVPGAALRLLARVLAHMAAGQGVAIVPSTAELTTQQAADLLNVSRPYLIRLLEEGQIDFRKVGTHRRVLMQSLVEYKRADDARRRSAADELAALEQELGLS